MSSSTNKRPTIVEQLAVDIQKRNKSTVGNILLISANTDVISRKASRIYGRLPRAPTMRAEPKQKQPNRNTFRIAQFSVEKNV
jgi:hypothetical protein